MSHVGLQDINSGLRAQSAMLPHGLLRPFLMGLGARRGVPGLR